MNSSKYDQFKYSKAVRSGALRVIVAVYICYLAFKIASAEDTSMSKTLCWVIGGAFTAAAIGFIVYSYKRFRADLEDAKLKEDEPVKAIADEISEDSELSENETA